MVFKRILTIEEAAFVAGLTVKTIGRYLATKKLRYRLWMAGFRGPQKVIDTADLIEVIDRKYPYPENLDTSLVTVRKYLRLKGQLKQGNETQRARKEAARRAAEDEASQPTINSDEAQVAAFRADRGESPEDEAPADQSDGQSPRTASTQFDPDIQGRPLK